MLGLLFSHWHMHDTSSRLSRGSSQPGLLHPQEDRMRLLRLLLKGLRGLLGR